MDTEKEPEGDWNFWLLSLNGTVESHTLEEKFTVCMPKSADDQTIDVDSETDVILSYNGKSDSRYTDSDPVKSTAVQFLCIGKYEKHHDG